MIKSLDSNLMQMLGSASPEGIKSESAPNLVDAQNEFLTLMQAQLGALPAVAGKETTLEKQTTPDSLKTIKNENIDLQDLTGKMPEALIKHATTEKTVPSKIEAIHTLLTETPKNKLIQTNEAEGISRLNRSPAILPEETVELPLEELAALKETIAKPNFSPKDLQPLVDKFPELAPKINQLIQASKESHVDNKQLLKIGELIQKDLELPALSTNIGKKVEVKLELAKEINKLEAEQLPVKSKFSPKVSVQNSYQSQTKSLFAAKPAQIIIPAMNQAPEALKVDSPKEPVTEKLLTVGLDENQGQEDFQTDIPVSKTSNVSKSAQAKGMDIKSVLGDGKDLDTVITKIQDYIIQTKVSQSPKLEVAFTHEDLGAINLKVERGLDNSLKLEITSSNEKAHEAFKLGKKEIMQSLAQSGVTISEFKLETGNGSLFKGSQDNSAFDQDERGQHNQSSNQDKDSKKRKELWNMFYEDVA